MNETNGPALTAYIQSRAASSARTRWQFALMLFAITSALLALHLLGGTPVWIDAQPASTSWRSVSLAYLAVIAASGILAGPRPRPLLRLQDDVWMGLLTPAAGALATLDAASGDISAFTLICLPIAVFHGSSVRGTILLQASAFAFACAGILWHARLDPVSSATLLGLLGIAAMVFACAGLHIEGLRRHAFISTWEPDASSTTPGEPDEDLEHGDQAVAEHGEAPAQPSAESETANQRPE